MPSVRVTLDRRGYRYVSLIQPSSRSDSPAGLLYWFRSPPGLKVGREPFDASARAALPARYPKLTFDWARLSELPVPPPEEPWRARRRAERAAKARAEDLRSAEASSPPEVPTTEGPEVATDGDAIVPPPATAAEGIETVATGPSTGQHDPSSSPEVAAAGTGRPRHSRRRRRRPRNAGAAGDPTPRG